MIRMGNSICQILNNIIFLFQVPRSLKVFLSADYVDRCVFQGQHTKLMREYILERNLSAVRSVGENLPRKVL